MDKTKPYDGEQAPWTYLLEHDEHSQTIGDLFRQLEGETGKLTFLGRLWQYLSTFLKTVLNTLAHFCDPGPQFRAYLDASTNTFSRFYLLQGCETGVTIS